MTTQIRLYKDTLGLSPKGRQNLRWRLPEEVPPQLELIQGGKSNVRRLKATDQTDD